MGVPDDARGDASEPTDGTATGDAPAAAGDPGSEPAESSPPDSGADEPAPDSNAAATVPGQTTARTDGLAGPRVVLVLYAVLVAVGGAAGTLVVRFVPNLARPELYGVIPLPATTLGFAAYGAITIATVLGVPLAFVVAVSRRMSE